MNDKKRLVGNHGKDESARKPRGVGEAFNADFRGYVNVNLTDAQKADWSSWSVTPHVWAQLEASVSDGVNLSLKPDPKGAGYLASATMRRVSSPNAGLVVTARGGEAGIAFTRVLFILSILGEHERWEATQPVANPDRW